MARTITGGFTTTPTITPAITLIGSDNPLLITTGAEGAMGIVQGTGFAIRGDNSQTWTITNEGTVNATGLNFYGVGISLAGAGVIQNSGTASEIVGYTIGIVLGQGGTVGNDGTIAAGGRAVVIGGAAGTVTNSGTITGTYGHAIYLAQGGSVSNSGTLFGLHNGANGVRVDSQTAIVTNTGSIDGQGGGIQLYGGGTVSNLGTAASISGFNRGVEVDGGTVINEGSITSSFDAVTVYGGGYVGNSGAASYIRGSTGVRGGGGALTVTNAGTINGTGGNSIYLQAGGTVTNSGTLLRSVRAYGDTSLDNTGTVSDSGGNAVEFNAGGTVVNGSPSLTSALITAAYGDGVRIGDSSTSVGTVTNDGTITGHHAASGPRTGTYPYSAGVRLLDGGTITNGTGGNTLASISGSVGVQTGHYYNRYPDRGFEGGATVINAGTIAGIDRIGVALYGGGTLINGGLVTGYSSGVGGAWNQPIAVLNDGTITASGTYSTSYGIGVHLSGYGGSRLTNGSTINHAALVSGAYYGVWAPDGSTIDNHGTILGDIAGIEINSGTVTNGEGGLISGTQNGVYMLRTGLVTNEGSIAGGTAAGVRMKGGTLATNGTANATAQIEGTIGIEMGFSVIDSYGTYASGPGTVVNAGTVLGHAAVPLGYGFPGDSGIAVLLGDGGSVGNSGYLYGDYTGIRITSAVGTAGTVGNTGTIGSQYYGVSVNGAAATVTNEGSILAAMGIELKAGGTASNLGTAALISGGGIGIYFRAGGGAGTVTNEGTITAHYAVYLHDGGSLTNSGTAASLGSSSGTAIRAGSSAAVTIVNEGAIGGYDRGIRMAGGGTVTNGGTANATALISGYTGNGIGAYLNAATIVNHGTITSAYAKAIYLKSGGSVTNEASGTISAGASSGFDRSGIYAADTATVTNSGTITGDAGVWLKDGSVTNSGTASYIGGSIGVYGAPSGGGVDVLNEGGIAVVSVGILLQGGGTITNSGTAASIASGDAGIVIADHGAISNEGTVWSHGLGIAAGYGRFTIVNGAATNATALIQGDTHGGIVFTAASGKVANFGTISGYSSGVAFEVRKGLVNNGGLIEATDSAGPGYGVVLGKGGRLVNTGTITGTYGVVAGYPCGCSPGGAATIVNKGTIIGSGGVAAQLGSFDDSVALSSRAAFAGAVIGAGGTDTLTLLGGGPVGTLSGLGTTITGFEILSLPNNKSRWTIAGGNTLEPGATIESAGRLTVDGALYAPTALHINGPGTLSAGAGSIEIGGTGGGTAGRITIDAGGTLSGNGVLRGPVVDRGLIEVSGGTLTTLGNVGGSGTIAITAGAVLDARANLLAVHIDFAGTGTDETLLAAKADKVTGTISGFADHDVIDLTTFLADLAAPPDFVGDVLTLHELGGPGTAQLHFAPGLSLADFTIAHDGGGGTLITHA